MFFEQLKRTQEKENSLIRTENGALAYKTDERLLEDVFFKLSSYRNLTDKQIVEDFDKLYKNMDKVLFFKFLFYIRDIRGGVGERRLFKVVLKHLADKNELPAKYIKYIGEYGRFDDMLILLDTPYRKQVCNYIFEQLRADTDNYKKNKPISLLAKWLPSVNTSSKETKRYAKIICSTIGISEKLYRQTLSKLRSYSNVVEQKMCANEWNTIDYNLVPSKANLIYKNAFLNHDPLRRNQFIVKAYEQSVTGKNLNVNYNARTLFPYEICANYEGANVNIEYETMWKNLNIPTDLNGTLVVADTSASMRATVGSRNVSACDVAQSLAIMASEHNSGEFKNKVVTFSTKPSFIEFNDNQTLKDKMKKYNEYSIVADTNIEAVFNLILNTALENNMSKEDLPKRILIISDMEFNRCVVDNTGRGISKTLFEVIEKRFKDNGYEMPKLVFWNVISRTNGIPTKTNELGVILVSGFSQNVFNLVMSNEVNPYKAILEVLLSERYSLID